MPRAQTDARLKEIQQQVLALAAEAESLIKDEIKEITLSRKLKVKNLVTLDICNSWGKELENKRIEYLVTEAYRDIFGRDINDFIINQGTEE